MKRLLILAALLVCSAVSAQNEYRDIATLKRMNETVRGIRSMADGEHYTILERGDIRRYQYTQQSEGVSLLPESARHIEITDYQFSADEQQILIASGSAPIYRHSYTTTYYLVANGRLEQIMTEAVAPRDATFSPDGRMIVYSDQNNLWVYDIAARKSRALTTDGAWNQVINGTTDWVYEEEFGKTVAYAFSPDSREVSFLRFDESRVAEFQMMRFDGKLYNEAYTFKYPKAGEANSVIELWTVNLTTGAKVKVDTGRETDQYIPRLGYTPDGRLWYFRLNRRQNIFEMVVCEPSGAQHVAYEERARQYVERVDDQTITFLDKNRFIVRQESHTGYMHLYLYTVRGGLQGPITRGDWEVTELVGTDGKRVWYLSTEGSPLQRALYSVRIDGKDKRLLTTEPGYYTIAPSAGMKYYISTHSSATTPNRVAIATGDGKVVRTLRESAALKAELQYSKRPVKEFFSFTTERGDVLNAYLIKPADFDPSKRYPVLLTQYSGPGSQSVADRWTMDWEDALVEKGYIVACTDGRGTGYRGEQFKKVTYGRLGQLEVEDQISFANYLAKQSYIDSSRIGIYGWSYGGFMALGCALKGLGLFKMAIAVAPVTSWRFYDTIYTEIYNNLPQYNAAGYDENSPINFARMLDDKKTRLLIIHGTADDNVHFQNTVEMTRALNRAGKQYDMMVYPDQNHSMRPHDTVNVRQKMVDYCLENL